VRLDSRFSRVNDVLYAIHRDIAADLSGRNLCQIAAYSEQHFHRVFRQIIGESLHAYILRTRLEHAANQLTFDLDSPIVEVAQKVGFSSLSSFGRAFKSAFGTSPGRWRNCHRKPDPEPHCSNPEIIAAFQRIHPLPLPVPVIEELAPRHVAYVRHLGYGRSITRVWQVLRAWAAQENRSFAVQIGLHHSNPAWVELDKCRYVACIGVDQPVVRRGPVSSLTIPGGTHARFSLKGQYGELLPWISKMHGEWLAQSDWKLRTTPAFAVYHRNHFVEEDEKFELDYFLPVSLY